MTTLPKAYMRVAREITGYWGTYLPSLDLEPGVIGRVVDGIFVREGHFNQFSGYDPSAHSVQDEGDRDPVSLWTTRHVNLQVLDANGSAPAGAASVSIQMRFGGANEAAIICHGNSYRSFTNLRAVKDLMKSLLAQDQWDPEQCIITEVLATRKAWICFSTEKDQTAELRASAPLVAGADPLGILKAAGGHADLAASSANMQAAGYSTTLFSGGTPLFRALKFQRGITHPFTKSPEYLKGASSEFVEPAFGE